MRAGEEKDRDDRNAERRRAGRQSQADDHERQHDDGPPINGDGLRNGVRRQRGNAHTDSRATNSG
ncbi:MAG: hypothetical protein QM775_36550 [Pirellulales bacterium]